MKNLLVLNYEFPPLGGGASPVSFNIAKGLSETGDFDIDVVTMGFKGLPKYEEINPHLRIHRVKCWRSKKEICYPWEQATYLISGYKKCKELISKKKYNICHCHFIIPTGILAFKIKKDFGLPYIITAHGSDVPGFNPDRFVLFHKFSKPILDPVCSNSKQIITGSRYLASLIRNRVNKDLNIIVIRQGIDVNAYCHPTNKKKIILSTGRMVPRKGFQHLINSVTDTDIGYEVHICGDGPMMSKLKKMAEKSKTKIIFHGWLDNTSQNYRSLLEEAAIYCLLSQKENSSVSIIEAMAAGCAIITNNSSGCSELVGNSGILINSLNKTEILFALQRVINSTKLQQYYQKCSREKAIGEYRRNAMLDQYSLIASSYSYENK